MSTTPFNSDAKKNLLGAAAFNKSAGAVKEDARVPGMPFATKTDEPGAKEASALFAPKTDGLSQPFDFVTAFLPDRELADAKKTEAPKPAPVKADGKAEAPATEGLLSEGTKGIDLAAGAKKTGTTEDTAKTTTGAETPDGTKITKFEDIFKFDSLVNPNTIPAKKTDEKATSETVPPPVKEVVTTQLVNITYFAQREEEESKRLEEKRSTKSDTVEGRKEDSADVDSKADPEVTEAKTLSTSEYLNLQTDIDNNSDGEITREELKAFFSSLVVELEALDKQDAADANMPNAKRADRASERAGLKIKLEATSAISSRIDNALQQSDSNDDVVSGPSFSFGRPNIFNSINIPSFFKA